jgi:hypothetical protein
MSARHLDQASGALSYQWLSALAHSDRLRSGREFRRGSLQSLPFLHTTSSTWLLSPVLCFPDANPRRPCGPRHASTNIRLEPEATYPGRNVIGPGWPDGWNTNCFVHVHQRQRAHAAKRGRGAYAASHPSGIIQTCVHY